MEESTQSDVPRGYKDLHDDFAAVKVCNYANAIQVGFVHMYEHCFPLSHDFLASIGERFRQFYFFIKRWIPKAKKAQKTGSRLVLLWNKAQSWYLFITFTAIKPNMQKSYLLLFKEGGYFSLSPTYLIMLTLPAFFVFIFLKEGVNRKCLPFSRYEAISSEAQKRYLSCTLEALLIDRC